MRATRTPSAPHGVVYAGSLGAPKHLSQSAGRIWPHTHATGPGGVYKTAPAPRGDAAVTTTKAIGGLPAPREHERLRAPCMPGRRIPWSGELAEG